jgi:hypothetical protein
MIHQIINLFLGCRHRRITRPITPVHKGGLQPGVTYVACLDCGQQLHYDMATMTVGRALIPKSSAAFNNDTVQRWN